MPDENAPQPPVRFGLIGTGRITRRLVADLQSTPGVAVTAIASRTSERAQWCADQYGIGQAVQGYAELLARDDVDAVYISLPPSMHAEWVIAAANAGKDVLCEKPLATCRQEAQEIVSACERARVRWLDATAWLHHERTDAFAQMIHGGELGVVRHVSASVSFFEPFQSDDHRMKKSLGGGCVLDLAWYAAGVAVFATDADPVSVHAEAVMKNDVPFRATAMLRFSNDVSATVSCGWDTATRKWFEVAGSAASLICDDFTRPWADKPARCWIHDAAGKVDQRDYNGNQEQAMIRRLISDSDLTSWQRQAIRTQSVLDAISQSIQSGESIILDPKDAHGSNADSKTETKACT